MRLIKHLQASLLSSVMFASAASVAADGLSEADRAFVTKAAQGGLMEVAAGKLAARLGLDPAVKDFGLKMVTDHTAANEKLKSIADTEQLVLPNSPSEDQNTALGKLGLLTGNEFDKAYVRMMVKDHVEDIGEFQKEANKGQNVRLKSFAADTLPTLQQHLTMAKELDSARRK